MNVKERASEFKKAMLPTMREFKFMMKRVKKSPLSIIGITILAFYAVVALLAPVLAPPVKDDPYLMPRDKEYFKKYGVTPVPPNEKHIFGTAYEQYDLFYGCMWGTRTAFRIGFMVVGISLIIGVSIGIVAGYYGGVVDELLMRFTDIIYAFPGLILAMAIVIAFGRSLTNVLLALVIVGWPTYTRVIRSEILKVKEEDYVEAAKAVGCSDLRVMVKHILPNSVYSVLIMASLNIGAIVLTAAALSFLGLGATTDFADWGQLINTSQPYIMGTVADPFAYWHTYTIPGLFIFIFVLGWNLLGDAFRDILDPTIRRR